ncbi:HAD-IIB family hydrolase [Singulisphaera sp. Ch08]|uniref:HAD-IIB family hydrolase n=1 Tax=Singulisphaera sp. Ch08 TaxID=3120278 RepID=A0AAU7CKL8_9BACT
MRYLALAADYDGTLATHGRVEDSTLEALGRLRESGRRLILVTGRELDELLTVFPRPDLFDRIVAENGALLYRPATREEQVLGEPPPDRFVATLKERGVGPISVGRVIVATWEPHESVVLETIRDLGLELHVIFNKGAIMVLPSGVNKATGLAVALDELGLSPHNTVGVGDAENDHAFLAFCECSAAVDNALPILKERADLVLAGDHGAGVVELIDRMIADDLAEVGPRLRRHAILLGRRDDGEEEWVAPYGVNILVAGTSGSGKSTLTTGLVERLAASGYQFVVVDPEGDYENLSGAAAVLGDSQRAPAAKEVLDLLELPRQNVVVNLLGIELEHRPAFFQTLLPQFQELRARTGRPHWVVVDEAHHLLPTSWRPTALTLPQHPRGMLLITVHPERIDRAVLESVDLLLAVGESPDRTVLEFCRASGRRSPLGPITLEPRETLAWPIGAAIDPFRLRSEPPRLERRRHSRKYAEGDLGPDHSFRFRGPEGKLNLRAQNLILFLQMADGVDDETWTHHLRQGDYSTWFRDMIKDDELATEAEQIEAKADSLSPQEGRAAIRAAIEARYTLPAAKASGDTSPDPVESAPGENPHECDPPEVGS